MKKPQDYPFSYTIQGVMKSKQWAGIACGR